MKVEVREQRLRFARPVATAYGAPLHERHILIVTLTAGDGVKGFGEAAPLEPYDGISLAEVREALAACESVLESTPDDATPGAVVAECRAARDLPQALAAVDLALWDMAGRRAGRSVASLLAESPAAAVEVNASLDARSPRQAADEAGEAARAGFRTLKLKVGTDGDAARVAAVRAAVGPDVRLRVDANGAWDVDEAVTAIRELARFDLELVEEPVHGIDDLRTVRERVAVPIAMDETAGRPGAPGSGATDAVCLKIAASGGLTGLLAQAAEARAAGSTSTSPPPTTARLGSPPACTPRQHWRRSRPAASQPCPPSTPAPPRSRRSAGPLRCPTHPGWASAAWNRHDPQRTGERSVLEAMPTTRVKRSVRARALTAAAATLGTLVALAGGAAGGSTAGAADGARAAQSDARPNILLIETDDQTLENQRVLRNVNSLIGAQGVTFDSSFVSYPLCCPARATTLTGQYAHNHQVLNNTRATGGGYYRFDGSSSLPVWLQRAGYATVHLGKYLNQYGSRNPTEIPPGWTEWHGLVDPTTYRFYNYTFNDDGIVHPHGNSGADYQTDVISSMAQEIIRRRAASPQPFFMWTAFLAPHAGQPREADDPQGLETPAPAPRHKNAFASEPLPRPPSFNEADVSDKPAGIRGRGRFDQGLINRITELYRQRMESLLAVDEGVAAIMQALQQTGELDSTLVIFTSDNGYFHGEHRVPAGKVLVYEPSIRVPLLMRGPGIPRGAHRSQVVANIDVAPTIVDAAGARASVRAVDGRSLLPLAADGGLQWGRDLLFENGTSANRYQAIRTSRYKYVKYVNGEREFYDLARDPYELQSALTADNRRIRSSLARRLDRLITCRGSQCRRHPSLKLSLSYKRGRTASGISCARGAVRAQVRGKDSRSVEKVSFYVGGRRVITDGHSPFSKRLALSRFTAGELNTVRARATVKYDRLLTLDRSVRRC